MKNINSDLVWERILTHAGQVFTQIRGKEFTYSIRGNVVYLNSTNRSISKRTVEQALEFFPLHNTVPLQHLQAPSYLYAILTDERINTDLS